MNSTWIGLAIRLMRNLPLIVLTYFMLTSCRHLVADDQQKFIIRYYAHDFTVFHNIHIYVRGRDERGNRIIVFDSLKSLPTKNHGSVTSTVIAEVSAVTDSIIRIRRVQPSGHNAQPIDSLTPKRIIRQFLKYKVKAIIGGNTGDVSFAFHYDGTGATDLTRIADKNRFVDPYFNQDYVQVQGPWYERKTND